jgi:DNA-binding transcriptional LysR family regulator
MEQLEYLTAVTRLGSLRRAAEELHLSQPALSETVRNLERELGIDLLERKRSGATMSAERASHPLTQVEVVGAQQSDIHRALLDGGFDLGLVNHLEGDDVPADFESTELLRGRPVVCVRPDSPLASLPTVTAADLLAEPLITMRSGYVMRPRTICTRRSCGVPRRSVER